MNSTRVIATLSGLLGLAAFIGVLVLAPVEIEPDHHREHDSAHRSSTSMRASVRQIRQALIDGRTIASVNLAQIATQNHPGDPDAWMWLAITADRAGDAHAAAEAASRQLELLTEPARPHGRRAEVALSGSERLYRIAWAHQILGRTEAARQGFAEAAEALAGETEPGNEPFIEYNLACYWAMAGQPDRAAAHFGEAVDAGYGDDRGWWGADPDLDPIRQNPEFVRATERLAARLAARRNNPWSPDGAEPFESEGPDGWAGEDGAAGELGRASDVPLGPAADDPGVAPSGG